MRTASCGTGLPSVAFPKPVQGELLTCGEVPFRSASGWPFHRAIRTGFARGLPVLSSVSRALLGGPRSDVFLSFAERAGRGGDHKGEAVAGVAFGIRSQSFSPCLCLGSTTIYAE